MKLLLMLLSFSCVIKAVNIERLNTLSPDFDISLGKGDSYFNKFYTLWQDALEKGELWGRSHETPQPAKNFIKFCKDLYGKHTLNKVMVSKKPRIPLIIHQIWLGSPFPAEYKKWQKTWKSMPGWKYILWTDKDIERLNLKNKDIYNESKNYGQRSDIARVEILNKFGGIYVDVDFECLNPEAFTLLNKAYDFYIGLEPLDVYKFSVNNALMASIPNHPFLKGFMEELRKNWFKTSCPSATYKIVEMTGPKFISKLFWKYCDKDFIDIILPPSFIYPLGIHQAHSLDFPPHDQLKRMVSKPETIAIHWWAGSWRKSKAQIKDNL